jgi:hypothetical protein
VAMVNDQASRQACHGRHICSVRGPYRNPILCVSLYETASHISDNRSRRSDASENRVDLFAPRKASSLPDDRSPTIQDDDRGRPDDAKLPDEVQVGLRVDIHVADVVQPRGHVAQQRARRATWTAKGGGELHQGRPRSKFGAELSSGQDVAAMPSPKPSVHEHQPTGD